MDSNAIQIAVRVRPWHPEKELPFVQKATPQPFFQGDGNFGQSPAKVATQGSLREVVEVVDHRMLDFDKPQVDMSAGRRTGPIMGRRYKNRKYVFDQVFGMEASQEEVFAKTAKSLLPGVVDGYNATVFAYGATGCGKTHTISGTEEQPGIIIRTMRELFDLVEETKDKFDTYFEMSMVEIYNETIRDLLHDDYPSCPHGGLKLLENEKERVTIDKVTLRRPTSVEEVMELVLLGNERRSTSFTERNSESSRSHLVLQINVGRNERGTDIDVANSVVRQCSTSATLSIIDLAGSEKASVNRGQRMKEGANINKSLLALSSCISALCQRPVRGARVHVPYRDSKLTRLLKFSLGGNCRTVMINCISPSSRDIEETNNTLLWADKAKKVSTKVSRNTAGVELRTAQWLQKIVTLEETIKTLRGQLNNQQSTKSGLQQKRLDKATVESEEELGRVQSELDALLPVIVEGSEMDALWNASVLQVEALDARMEDIGVEVKGGRPEEDAKREKDHLRALIQQQDDSFRFNNEIQAGVQSKSLKHITLANLLKKAEERQFGDDMSEAMYKHQLKVAEHRAHIARSVAAARERGLRDYISQQAEALTKAASTLSRFSTTIRSEAAAVDSLQSLDDLAAFRGRMHSMGRQVDHSVAAVFGTDTPHPLPLPHNLLPLSIPAPSPRRASLGRHLSRPPSPKSGLRKTPFPAPDAPKETKKQLRWPDQTGEGKIDDRSIALDCPVFTSPSVSIDGMGSAADRSLDIAIKDEDRSELVPSALRPDPAPTAAFANTSLLSSLATVKGTEDVPAWKQMRLERGLGSQADNSGDLSVSSNSPLGASKPGTKGLSTKLHRPGPLGELSLQIPAHPSPPSTSSVTNLHKSSITSAGKAGGSSAFANIKISMPSSDGTMPPPPVLGHRRESMIGPARHDRPRQRLSMIPSHGETSFSGFSHLGKGLPSGMSALSGGAKRLGSDGKRRMSVQVGHSTSTGSPPVRGPALGSRPSMSNFKAAASSPGNTSGILSASRGLSSRASVSRLNAGDTYAIGAIPRPSLSSRPSMARLNAGVAVGDATGRPAWR
ncbi:kinesin [Cryptococcus wingfieldii CBS 7118]|uniref:Kinesin n=1 Tax=Cryptococcus wingfieldii CBS 7118 TaxID=1295528 RepID=A0A1E3K6R0_9TREE|nr:kinesin [Cryptococcus wingfieldii CBS 7118]ODO08830.1 kinesin [Cryptococcus wingfieldii CBS 7118]